MKNKILLPLLLAVCCVQAEEPKTKRISGSTVQEVNALLKDWKQQADSQHPKTQRCYYSADAEIVVAFKDNHAAGVAVISRRGTPFSITRYRELCELVAGGHRGRSTSSEHGTVSWSFGPVEWGRKGGGSKPLKPTR